MPKTTTKSNYRVAVWPKTHAYGFKVAEDDGVCLEIIEHINRHVDDVHYAEVIHDSEHTCSHCGAPWTEDSVNYNGGCCDKDQAEQVERHKGHDDENT